MPATNSADLACAFARVARSAAQQAWCTLASRAQTWFVSGCKIRVGHRPPVRQVCQHHGAPVISYFVDLAPCTELELACRWWAGCFTWSVSLLPPPARSRAASRHLSRGGPRLSVSGQLARDRHVPAASPATSTAHCGQHDAFIAIDAAARPP